MSSKLEKEEDDGGGGLKEGWAEIQEVEFVDLAAAAVPPGTSTWTRPGLAKINFNQRGTGENGREQ
jgi:hypothetical protein